MGGDAQSVVESPAFHASPLTRSRQLFVNQQLKLEGALYAIN